MRNSNQLRRSRSDPKRKPKKTLRPIARQVVGIGASMGGISALKQVLSGLDASFPAAVVIVQHISSQFESRLAEYFGRCTALPVKEAESGDRLREGNVFVAPPNFHVSIARGGVLILSAEGTIHFVRPSVEPLFKSMAKLYRQHAIGVVLTGYGNDGSTGVQLIKVLGGRNIAQDQATSQDFRMPQASIATGDIDFVLPIEEIASKLADLTGRHPLETG